MTSRDFVRHAYCSALLALCKKKNLNKITVNDVVNEVGTARQTFYNYFRDINDLICYIPAAFYAESHNPPYTRDGIKASLYYTLENKEYFSQVPYHEGQNSFRETYLRWMKEGCYALALKDITDEVEYLQKRLLIDGYIYASVELYYDWCKEGMKWPPELLLDAVFEMRPDILRDYDTLDFCGESYVCREDEAYPFEFAYSD